MVADMYQRKAKNKIKKAVEELDYIPNQWIRNLYKKRTGIIGVMTPDIIHPYFSNSLELS